VQRIRTKIIDGTQFFFSALSLVQKASFQADLRNDLQQQLIAGRQIQCKRLAFQLENRHVRNIGDVQQIGVFHCFSLYDEYEKPSSALSIALWLKMFLKFNKHSPIIYCNMRN
jgi:hypothetical protein